MANLSNIILHFDEDGSLNKDLAALAQPDAHVNLGNVSWIEGYTFDIAFKPGVLKFTCRTDNLKWKEALSKAYPTEVIEIAISDERDRTECWYNGARAWVCFDSFYSSVDFHEKIGEDLFYTREMTKAAIEGCWQQQLHQALIHQYGRACEALLDIEDDRIIAILPSENIKTMIEFKVTFRVTTNPLTLFVSSE